MYVCIFRVEEYLSSGKEKNIVDPDPNGLYMKRKEQRKGASSKDKANDISTSIHGHHLNWVQSWLLNRTQQVVLEGEHSEKSNVKSGVPQGTVLKPLCFLLYINNMGITSHPI